MIAAPVPPHIAVFDSGVGGLTIAAEIARLIPDAAMTYVCDNGFFPYGTKAEDVLADRVDQVVAQAMDRVAPDLLVVACNTASTIALPRLRARTAIPVVGTVPAVKPAAALSRRRVIGLLGTPGTVSRAYTDDLIERFAEDCTVLRVGSVELVELAERSLEGTVPSAGALARILAPFLAADPSPDIVVLACTHFPLLRDALAAAAPGLTFIDSGRAVAERVRSLLGHASAAGPTPIRRALFTADDAGLRRRLPAFAARGFAEVGFLR